MSVAARFFVVILILGALSACSDDNKPQFDKIIFHTTMCFGACPVFHLELNENKKLKLYAEIVPTSNENWKNDTSKTGYFEGVVSDSTFNKLSKIIKTIGIDTLTLTTQYVVMGQSTQL